MLEGAENVRHDTRRDHDCRYARRQPAVPRLRTPPRGLRPPATADQQYPEYGGRGRQRETRVPAEERQHAGHFVEFPPPRERKPAPGTERQRERGGGGDDKRNRLHSTLVTGKSRCPAYSGFRIPDIIPPRPVVPTWRPPRAASRGKPRLSGGAAGSAHKRGSKRRRARCASRYRTA